MISRGYVALFESPIDRERIRACVSTWLERFEGLEQITPERGTTATALRVHSLDDIMWQKNLQFRVLHGIDFAWVYATLEKQVMETSGLPVEDNTLCLDVLMELPGIIEVIDEHNDKRLDQLEAEGLM